MNVNVYAAVKGMRRAMCTKRVLVSMLVAWFAVGAVTVGARPVLIRCSAHSCAIIVLVIEQRHPVKRHCKTLRVTRVLMLGACTCRSKRDELLTNQETPSALELKLKLPENYSAAYT